jgi:hypothetical protein
MKIELKYKAVIDGNVRDLDGPLADPFIVDGERHMLVSVNTGDTNASGNAWKPAPVRTTVYKLRKMTDGERDLLTPKSSTPAPITYPTRIRAARLFSGHKQISPWDEIAVLVPHGMDRQECQRRLRQLADGEGVAQWN